MVPLAPPTPHFRCPAWAGGANQGAVAAACGLCAPLMSLAFSRNLAVCLLVAALVGCDAKAKDTASASKPADGVAPTPTPAVAAERTYLTPVLYRTVERGEVRATVSSTGSIVPIRTVSLRTEEAGTLEFAGQWREGDAVTKGTEIARVDSTSLSRDIAINKADLELQDEALDIGARSLRQRQRDFETLQELYSRGISAAKEVDAARLEVDRAINNQRQNRISRQKAESQLKQTMERAERLAVRAPFDGILLTRATLEGQGKFQRGFGAESITAFDGASVSSGHVVCGIADVSTVVLRCDVTSKDIGLLAVGQEADIVLYSSQDIVRTGRVVRLSDSVSPDTRAFEVDIEIDNADRVLKPGMFGRSDIVVDRRRDTIALPRSVVTRRNNRDVVFIVESSPEAAYEVARQVEVELGIEGRDDIEVTFGVRGGDRVIQRGFEVLQDNTPVRSIDMDAPIRPEATPTPGPTPEPTPEGVGIPIGDATAS